MSFWPFPLGFLGFSLCCLATERIASAAEPRFQTFTANGVTLRYLTQGEGDPVVLIHGLHSSIEMNWQLPGIIDRLAPKYRIVAIDLPGHGRSDKPTNESAYGLQMVEDVVLLMDHLQIQKAHIVGYSMGGMVAMKLLSLHPDRVRSAAIGGMGWLREGSALQRSWEGMRVREGSSTPAECVHSLSELALSREELKAIHVPVMVLVGDRDPVRRMYVMPLTVARPDWPVMEIEQAGHLNCLAKPQFADELLNWLGKRK